MSHNRKYLAEHEADIAAYRAAQHVPAVAVRGEAPQNGYAESRVSTVVGKQEKGLPGVPGNKKAMQEIVTVKSNIDHLLGLTDAQKNKEMER